MSSSSASVALAFTPRVAPETRLVTSETPVSVMKALEKFSTSDAAKAVIKGCESEKKYSGEGLAYATFIDYHCSLETTMLDNMEHFEEALQLEHDTSINYYYEVNSKLFYVIWKTTQGDAKMQIKAFS